MNEMEMDDLFATTVAGHRPKRVVEYTMPADSGLSSRNFSKRIAEYACGCEFRWDHRDHLSTAFPCQKHLEQWQIGYIQPCGAKERK